MPRNRRDTTVESRLSRVVSRLRKILKEARTPELFLLSNAEMNALRRKLLKLKQFRGPEAQKIKKEKKVNVLSFPELKSFPSRAGKKTLGEIYVNRMWGKGGYHDLLPLVIHGFLHLLGYRHRRTRDRIAMEKKEQDIF